MSNEKLGESGRRKETGNDMDLYRVGLSGRNLEELQHIACRLSLYGEEWTRLDRDALRTVMSRAMMDIPTDELQRMLGFRLVSDLHDLAPYWKETDYSYDLDDEYLTKGHLRVMAELTTMGLARYARKVWKLDPIVAKTLEPMSDALQEELTAGDEMQVVLDEALNRWGAVTLDALMEYLLMQDDELGAEMLAQAVEEIMLCRHGQSAMEISEGRTMLLDPRAMYDEKFRKVRQGSLYRKLPYYIAEAVNGPTEETEILGSEAAYRYYALLDPSKSMPRDMSLLKGSVETACRRRVRHSERSRKLAYTLTSAAYLARTGERSEAEKMLLEKGGKLTPQSAKDELKDIVREYLDNCRQWELKGWTVEEVRSMQRMSDPPYLAAMDLQDGVPGFNDPCPCGSGKLFRLCHGRGN